MKVWERLQVTPGRFFEMDREKQLLLLLYAKERDLEEIERMGAKLVVSDPQ